MVTEVQGHTISTQNLHELVTDKPTEHTIQQLKKLIKSWFKIVLVYLLAN
jgi:hypothetical protein